MLSDVELSKLDIPKYSVIIVHRGNKSLKVKPRIFPNSKLFSTFPPLCPLFNIAPLGLLVRQTML